MDEYLLILKEKAKKIDADIESCANDKDCIKEVIAAKVKSNLENEKVSILIEKAQKIDADIKSCGKDKDCILVAIEQRIKTILEEESNAIANGTADGDDSFSNFILGLLLGIAGYLLFLNREKVMAMVSSLKEGN